LPAGRVGEGRTNNASSEDLETDDSSETPNFDDLEDEVAVLSPRSLHRLVSPALAATRRATATPQERALRDRYLRARDRLAERKRELRVHRMQGSGSFVELRRRAAALQKTVANAESRLRSVAVDVLCARQTDGDEPQ
jgi:hypothetical protein